MALVQASDFKSNPIYKIFISKQVETELSVMIDDVEENILQDLLGCELYGLFITDLDTNTPQVPQNSPFTEIFEAICMDDECGKIVSKGMVDMLQGFIYFEWERYNPFKATANGIVLSDSENSTQANLIASGVYNKYNRAVKSYHAIQEYICKNSELYPTYNGKHKEFTSYI